MKLSDYVDPTRCYQLVTGVIGIYFSYLLTGVIHESLMKEEYYNNVTKEFDIYSEASAFLIIPYAITWAIGSFINHYTIPDAEKVVIPEKKAALCGLTVAISTLTYTYAIYLSSFPVVMMFKSCNILSVILVGVCCSRVKDKKLKLGTKKLVVGVLVTLGIIIFKFFDPESAKNEDKQTEIFGIVLLLISLLADGFLPDFQAEIKSVYKPQPMEMMTIINKWVSVISFFYAIAIGQIFNIYIFLMQHHRFFFNIILMGVLNTTGQIFVYRMIKQFKQHFPPFVITTRKIFTVGLSLIWFNHETNIIQITGVILVFAMVTYEFVSELVNEQKNAEKPKEIPSIPVEQMIENDPSDNKLDISPGENVQSKEKLLYEERIGQKL